MADDATSAGVARSSTRGHAGLHNDSAVEDSDRPRHIQRADRTCSLPIALTARAVTTLVLVTRVPTTSAGTSAIGSGTRREL